MTKTESSLLTCKKKIRPQAAVKTNIPAKAWSECDYEADCENATKTAKDPFIEQVEPKIVDFPNSFADTRPYIRKKRKSKHILICGEKIFLPSRIPWVMFVLSVVQISIYCFSSDELYDLLHFSPYKRNEVWRFVTYAFLHSSVKHIATNISLQFLITSVLECEQGHWLVLILHLTGALSGGLSAYIFQRRMTMVGSSAAVYSTFMGHIPHMIMNFHSLKYKYYRLVTAIFFLISDFAYTINQRVFKEILSTTSIAAHLGGIYNGLLLSSCILLTSKRKLCLVFRCTFLILYLVSMTISVIIVFNCDSNQICIDSIMDYVKEYCRKN